MAATFTVDVRDASKAILATAEARMSPRVVNKIIGRAGQTFVRKHFYDLDAKRPNRMGGDRTHFYGGAARSTTFAATADGAVISVNQTGVRQRILGGPILPTKSKYLTIPARAEAYGKRAREFNNLKVVRFGNVLALVEADATKLRKTKKGFRAAGETGGGVMYWLVPKVAQKADPSVMPNLESLRVFVLEELRKAVAVAKGGAQ